MKVRNAYSAALGIRVGTLGPIDLAAGEEVEIPDGQWSKMQEHPVIAAWVADGKLVATGARPEAQATTSAKGSKGRKSSKGGSPSADE